MVSDIPGDRAVVQHGETGLIVPVGDAMALAQALIHLLSTPELRLRLGQAARQRIAREFGIEAVVRQLVVLYRGLTASSAPAGAPAGKGA